ncbi:ATP-binding cassette domain-containing protein [Nocardia wallacei]|uniref:Thiol reductant ABC exporter subunit CydC n=3 Tax=Nocardia wallacei TaxID=480035 RepID=A0A7G1KCD6_9NOCA|nr:ATP-binding cassette domain-containing protein [Nocardia wallacei]BCK52832.1 thiol reductant ABC exporter subunit CydC [Nocardia wallacei]
MRQGLNDFRRLRELLELSRWRIAVSIGWGTLALGSGLALAALAAWLIARAWQMPPVLDLSVAVVAVRALGIARGLCRYLERLATHDVALRAMTTARTRVYSALAAADIWTLRRGGSSAPLDNDPTRLRRGDLLTRIGTDIDDLGAVVVRAFVPIAVAVVLSTAAIGLLATVSLAAAGVLALALAVAGIVAPWLSAWAARAAETAVRADRRMFTAAAVTVLDHAPELRVAGRLNSALGEAAAAGQRAVAAEDRAASRSAWAAAATPLSVGASVLGALLIGIMLYGSGTGAPADPLQPAPPGGITPMALAVLVLLPLSAFEAVAVLPAAIQALTHGRAALHRITAIEHTPTSNRTTVDAPASTPRPTSSDAIASGTGTASAPTPGTAYAPVTDLRRAGPAERRLSVAIEPEGLSGPPGAGAGVSSVAQANPAMPQPDSRTIPPGRRIAVVGPSGAGKTTLLMEWAGLFDTPRPGVTFFAEDAHLFGTTVLENLRVARGDLTEAEAVAAVRAVGLGDWLDGLPEGLHTELVGGAAAVSGGQRRRLLLARALVAPADVLLLDEPTEHLEADAGADLLRALLDEHSGLVAPDRTVVAVTHQLPPDHRADTVVEVHPGGRTTMRAAAPANSLGTPSHTTSR